MISVDSDSGAAIRLTRLLVMLVALELLQTVVFVLKATHHRCLWCCSRNLTAINAVFFQGSNEGASNADVMVVFKADQTVTDL